MTRNLIFSYFTENKTRQNTHKQSCNTDSLIFHTLPSPGRTGSIKNTFDIDWLFTMHELDQQCWPNAILGTIMCDAHAQ